MSALPVIIDTDPGIDDTLALYLALNSPELDVRGIAVSYGTTTVEQAYRNAVEILRRGGKRARLAVGARRPLTRALEAARERHGDSGLGYAPLPPAGVILDFVRPLERLLAEQPAPVTLLTLGPLTSLALALGREPDLVRAKVGRHVAMAGSLAAPGTATAVAEFNAWCDPEALARVLAAELPTAMVGLDVTRQVALAAAEVGALGASEQPLGRWLFEALRFSLEFHRAHEGLEGCLVHEVLPVVALIEPEAITFAPARVAVGRDEDDRGRTREAADGAAALVASAVNVDAVRALLAERVLAWASAPLGVGA